MSADAEPTPGDSHGGHARRRGLSEPKPRTMRLAQQQVNIQRDNFADMRFNKCDNKCKPIRHKLREHGPMSCMVEGCGCPMFQVKGVTPDRNAPDQRPFQFCPKGHRLVRMTDAEFQSQWDSGTKFQCNPCHAVYYKQRVKDDEEPKAAATATSA